MLSRDWRCLNDACRAEFHSYDPANPPCPKCGCLRVDWVPGGGHIIGMSRRVDKELRNLADQHGFTNLNSPSPSRVNRAAPVLEDRLRNAKVRPELGTKHWGLGLTSGFGNEVTAANPATNLRGKVTVGQPFGASSTVPGPSANTVWEGRTKQRTIS